MTSPEVQPGPPGPVRWGVFGAGAMAAKFAGDVGSAAGASLAAVASRDPAKAAALAQAHGGRGAASYEALARDEDVDAIYVATPNALHLDHALMAIRAGKPVLVEKPFALDAAEARRIADAAREAGVFCMEAMWARFLPAVAAAKRAVEAGRIGAPTYLRAEIGFPAPTDPKSRFNDPALGGGALLDLGVYGVSMARWMLGPVEDAAATLTQGATGADRIASVQLRHGGAAASILASHAGELGNSLEVVGTEGRVVVEPPFPQSMRARIFAFPPPPESAPGPQGPEGRAKRALKKAGLYPTVRRLGRRLTGRDGEAIKGDFVGEGYQFQMEEVGRRLAAGETESPVMPLDETIEVMETLDRLRAG
ncbi:MAG: Gfo/Idh/MocA family oxidoreductase [Pseudomonadota bacterium]